MNKNVSIDLLLILKMNWFHEKELHRFHDDNQKSDSNRNYAPQIVAGDYRWIEFSKLTCASLNELILI